MIRFTNSIAGLRRQQSVSGIISRFRETGPDRLHSFHNLRYNETRRKVMRMDIRQKIDALLQKITSEDQLKRIYRFVKYIYIHTPK